MLAVAAALSSALLLGAPARAATPAPLTAAGRLQGYETRLAEVQSQLQGTRLAATTAGATFDPTIVISDLNFRAAGSMTQAQIQSFLSSQPGILKTYSATSVLTGATEPASQLIWEAAKAWTVSPKVILVTLQKEQGLLSATAPTAYALDWAMGCGVPDSGTLQTQYRGFGKQVWYGADSLSVDGAGWYAGITVKCGDGTVAPQNTSTYSLYRYTPWIAGNQLFWTVYWRYFGDPIGDVTPPTTTETGADAAWHDAPVTVTFTAIDNPGGSGVAYTQYSLDGGDHWTKGTSVTIAAPADHAGDGIHTIKYRSVDDSGNKEAAHSCTVRIDTTPPVVTSDAPAGWRHKPATVALSATDPVPPARTGVASGCSGAAYTEYSSDDGATWTRGTAFTVPAPADHSGDGPQQVLVRAADVAGNVGPAQPVTVRIDTRPPRAIVNWAASVRRGRPVALRYYVSDPRPGSPSARVVIKIRTLAGRGVKTLVAYGPVRTMLAARFVCWLPKGVYRFTVSARDVAGNAQVTPPASARLKVY